MPYKILRQICWAWKYLEIPTKFCARSRFGASIFNGQVLVLSLGRRRRQRWCQRRSVRPLSRPSAGVGRSADRSGSHLVNQSEWSRCPWPLAYAAIYIYVTAGVLVCGGWCEEVRSEVGVSRSLKRIAGQVIVRHIRRAVSPVLIK